MPKQVGQVRKQAPAQQTWQFWRNKWCNQTLVIECSFDFFLRLFSMQALSVTTTTALGNAGLLEADFNDLRRLEERVIQDSSLVRHGKRFIIVERRADFFGERWWRVRLLWVWSTSQYVNILPFPCQTKQAIISKKGLLNFITSRHKQYTLPKDHKRNNPNHWPHTQPKRSRNQPPIPVKARQV